MSTMGSGKAWSLDFLRSLGLQVPDWKVLSHDDIISWGNPVLWEEVQLAANTLDGNITDIAAKFVESIHVPEEAISGLRDQWLAVRSSASVEDSPENSFAGIFETKLFIKDNLKAAIVEVWSSLYSQKAITYCRDKNVSLSALSMDVIIQQIIIGDKSGVLFQADPMGRIDRTVINAGYGLGQGVVDETADTDQFVILGGQSFETLINTKLKQLTFNEDLKNVEITSVPDHLLLAPVLSHQEIEELLQVSRHIDSHTNFFMDIEFTIRNGQIFFLQARPITTIGPKKDIIVYDNSNIAENYPGQTSPLTFSSLSRAYSANFRNLIKFLGFPEKERQEIDNSLDYLVGHWGGQIYYNLNNWHKVYALLPVGQSKATDSFHEMVGVDSRTFIHTPERTLFSVIRSLLGIVPRFLSYFFLTTYYHKKYKEDFSDLYSEFRLKIANSNRIFEIISLIKELDHKYLSIIKIPLFNDFFSSILNKSCRYYVQIIAGDRGNTLLNDLLSHREDLESSRAIYSLLELADMVRENGPLKKFIQKYVNDPIFMGELSRYREFEAFDIKLRYHLDRYGDRSQWEMKLESPTARENPSILIKLILDYAILNITTAEHKERERKKAKKAETEINELVKERRILRIIFWYLFKKNSEALGFREDSRFDRVRIKGITRELALKLGEELLIKKRLINKEDIFFLTYDELLSLNYDNYGNDYFKELVELRKKYYRSNYNLTLSDRLIVNDLHPLTLHTARSSVPQGDLKGTPCSGGEVEGQVAIVKDLNEAPSLSGKILVAERTDPSWGYFFVGVKGIIIEKGSMLSHAAIISRELGIPCIINVTGATYTLKDGATIRMNGDTGEIIVV